jgi:hypothetical protein
MATVTLTPGPSTPTVAPIVDAIAQIVDAPPAG